MGFWGELHYDCMWTWMVIRRLKPWAPSMGPARLRDLSRVYIRYIRIPGSRAHTRGPWVHPKSSRRSTLTVDGQNPA